MAAPVGEGAEQQEGGMVDGTPHREDLVTAQAGQRAVGGPVDHRVQRAQEVRLGPG